MWSIQAAVAYPRARSARTLRDPASFRARSIRAWKRCSLSSSTITKASNSSGRVLVTLVLVNPKQVHLVAGSTIVSSLWKRCVWSIEHNYYLRPSLLTDTILCCSQFSETPSTPETLETRRMSYLRPSLRIVRIIRHRSEAGEEQRPVWASGIHWTEGKETCIKAPHLVEESYRRK